MLALRFENVGIGALNSLADKAPEIRTVITDKHNNILLAGDPLYSSAVWEGYMAVIQQYAPKRGTDNN